MNIYIYIIERDSVESIYVGNQHNLELKHCACEPLSMTMCRSRIWPSSPTNPRVGFSFEFLDWAEVLLYECQVALKDFCLAVNYKSPDLYVSSIYCHNSDSVNC